MVRDKPDDLPYGYSGRDIPYSAGDEVNFFVLRPSADRVKEKFMGGLDEEAFDKEPDVFYFNIMGHTGRFVLDKDRNVVMVPYQNIRIQHYLKSNADNTFNRSQWLVTLPDGTTFLLGSFDASTVVGDYSYKERTNHSFSFVNHCPNERIDKFVSFVSTWYLNHAKPHKAEFWQELLVILSLQGFP
ncbi:MAG: hypothetical protein AAF734_05420, partial [Bacteroidota bacterium]